MEPLKIFIGYDEVESVAFHVLCHSILSRATVPVSITPVSLSNLRNVYTRPRDEKQSNEFSFSRFLAPYLSGYNGWAVFMDCDMLVLTDIKKLFDHADPNKAAMVVKHSYKPRDETKYLGAVQYAYPRKNWSSVILWNCGHPANRVLTPEFVSRATPQQLHRFNWIADEDLGALPVTWNWLVGEYKLKDEPKGIKQDINLVHFTVGGPYFEEYSDGDFAEEWFHELDLTMHCKQRVLK